MFGLTVIIPNYNHGKFLPEALDSLLVQRYLPDEILIIDDASVDDSVKIILNYKEKSSRIKLIQNSQNLGVQKTVNKGIHEARYSHIATLGADDLEFPIFFEKGMKIIKENLDLGLVCGDLAFFEDCKPYQYEIYHFYQIDKPIILSPEQTIRLLRNSHFRIESNTCIYNTDLLKKYGCYKEALKSLCDHYLNYQIALRHPIAYVPEALSAHRIVKESYGTIVSKNKRAKIELYASFLRLISIEEDAAFKTAFKRANCLAKCGFFVIYFLFFNPKYWSFLPAVCLKKFPHLITKIWSRIRKRKSPIYPVKPEITSSLI